jgi:hypothetical protein
VIPLVVMVYVRFPLRLLSLRNVPDLLFERGIDVCHESVRYWWNRFGPMFAGDIRRQRVSRIRGFRPWRWNLDEMFVKLNGETVHLCGPSTMKARFSKATSPERQGGGADVHEEGDEAARQRRGDHDR